MNSNEPRNETARETPEESPKEAREAANGSQPEAAHDADDAETRAEPALPADARIIVPVRNLVLFPGMVMPLTVGRAGSIAAAQEAARTERRVGVLLQRDPTVENPGPEHLHWIGTTALILRYVTSGENAHHLVVQGVERFRVLEFLPGYPYLVARVRPLEQRSEELTPELEARMNSLKASAVEALQLLPNVPQEMVDGVQAIHLPAALADLIANYLDLDAQEKQEILATLDVQERLDRVIRVVDRQLQVLRLQHEISEKTRSTLSERQREHLLRQQLETIQSELGEGDSKSAEIAELRRAIAEANLPEEARTQAEKELRRLERMPEAAGEYSVIRSYLDWLIELPWSVTTEKDIDIAAARGILDADHFGLEKIKRRILEYLAVRKLNPRGRSPILCFVGPPGVGKTSLGQSIARATGRKFVRISLGGMHDEAEIRGHRRTYVGALPGAIVQAIHKAGAADCVFMLDEMDKLGSGSFRGDPSSALLEVLDPEQNNAFRDNYLGIPFDLSRVMFVATANVLDAIPGPLRDRMEIIELPGYTEEEKLQIARRYLVARQLQANGLTPEQCEIDDEALRTVIRAYTRESGCRNLEREIGAICRHVAVRIAEGQATRLRIVSEDLEAILGPPRFEREQQMRTSVPGVATGLAWTPVGGDILFVEASRAPGSGRLILTGQLGDVMKESAQAALSLVKSRIGDLGLAADLFEKSDIHVHVPAGAIPKDGPSAGVTLFVALVSLLRGQTVRSDVAMTGEISLRGLVLPVGGIKEKVLAAARAGITTVMLPARNRKDYPEIPEEVRETLRFVWLEHVDEAVEVALAGQENA